MNNFNLPKLTDDLNIIQSLPDQPTMSANELKAEFDKGTNLIKDYINNILIKGINDVLETLNGYDEHIESQIDEKFKEVYHVGKIITSSVDVNPSTYLGFGTWEYVGKGRVLIGVDPDNEKFNEGGKIGGSESIRLESKHLPSFSLSDRVVNEVTPNTTNTADLTFNGRVVTGVNVKTKNPSYINNSQQNIDITFKYETVYRYKRTA